MHAKFLREGFYVLFVYLLKASPTRIKDILKDIQSQPVVMMINAGFFSKLFYCGHEDGNVIAVGMLKIYCLHGQIDIV